MDTKMVKGSNRRSFYRYLESAEGRLNRLEQEARAGWTPGQILGELLTYIDRLENFTPSSVSASWAQKRMKSLTEALSESVQRNVAIGLEADELNAIFDALKGHDALLSAERSLATPAVKEARNLIRLEISLFDHI
jgi:hypothetical protein